MSDIADKLEHARSRAENYGKLYGAKETADDKLKGTYALLYPDYPDQIGTVAERDAWVKGQPEYIQAVKDKQNAYADWKTAETYMKILMVEAEVWRTEQANNRYMDEAHR